MGICSECRAQVADGADMSAHLQWHARMYDATEYLGKSIDELRGNTAELAKKTGQTFTNLATELDKRFSLVFTQLAAITRILS